MSEAILATSADLVLQTSRDRHAVAEGARALRHVQERLVDRDGLDEVRHPAEDFHDALRLARVLADVGGQVDPVRAAAKGLGDRHRAADAEPARLV
jgi:hypothetical protein